MQVELAAIVNAVAVSTPQEVSDSADWYIVALSDKVYDGRFAGNIL